MGVLDTKSEAILPSRLAFLSEIIFSVNSKEFRKNRYGNGGDYRSVPQEIKRVLTPILSIMIGEDYEELVSKYFRSNLVTAIYLTGSYSKFREIP